MTKMRNGIAMLLCAFILFAGIAVPAEAATIEEVEPRASAYLDYYTAWASISSSGKVYVYYDVDATGYIGYLGAKLIVVQKKDGSVWRDVATYTGSVSNGMLVRNDSSHLGSITYTGTVGNTYRAVVTIYGGSTLTNGDSRIVTTNSV